jgi:hypothetical protein
MPKAKLSASLYRFVVLTIVEGNPVRPAVAVERAEIPLNWKPGVLPVVVGGIPNQHF